MKPIIDRTFPLERIVDAHRYMESNQQKGKIVVTVWLREKSVSPVDTEAEVDAYYLDGLKTGAKVIPLRSTEKEVHWLIEKLKPPLSAIAKPI